MSEQLIKTPVRVEEDFSDKYAVYRLFDDDDVLLLNFQHCERYQSPEVLKGARKNLQNTSPPASIPTPPFSPSLRRLRSLTAISRYHGRTH